MSVEGAMYTIKQQASLPVMNFDLCENGERSSIRKHGVLFPNAVRALICGPSGCGKTNIMFSILTEPNGLKFENVYVYSKSLYQPKYQVLSDILKLIKGMCYHPYSENDDIIDPSEAKENSVFIFDDVACDKQNKIRAYFAMGRHKNIDSFYLCQTYTRIPKHLIRDNANVLVLFKQDDMNLKHVYDDHVSTDMPFEEFKNLCRTCWEDKHGVLVIVKENDLQNGRYRKGFDEFICRKQWESKEV